MNPNQPLPPIPGWPRVRPIAGGYLVRCRVLTTLTESLLRRLGPLCAALVGFGLIAVATCDLWAPPLVDAAEGTAFFRVLVAVASVRFWVNDLLGDRFPEFGTLVGWEAGWLVDWYVLGLGVVVVLLTHPLATLFTQAAALLLRPIVTRRFSVRVTKTHIRAGCGWVFVRRLPRGDNGLRAVRFRKAEARRVFRNAPVAKGRTPASVELICGWRRRRLLTTRADKAEAIVAACNEALARTHGPFPI